MAQDRLNPQDKNLNENFESDHDRFESDSQRIIHRHLENKDDIITDEDIASVKIGATPDFDEATAARFKGDEARKEKEDELLEGTEDMDVDENLKDKQLTPWDTIEGE